MNIQRTLAAAACLVLSCSILGTLPAHAADGTLPQDGSVGAGGGTKDGDDEQDPNGTPGSNAAGPNGTLGHCVNGQMMVGNNPFTLQGWPGCSNTIGTPKTGSIVNQFNSIDDAWRECVTGALVFRFYGTLNNPSANYTVTRVNLPNIEATCAPTKEGHSAATFGMLFTNPTDAPNGKGPKDATPWQKYDKNASENLKFQLTGSSNGPKFSDVYVINTNKGSLPTSGALLDIIGSCADLSKPAIHQEPGFKDGRYGTFDPTTGKITWQPYSYLEKVRAWAKQYSADYDSPALMSKLYGVAGSSGQLSDKPAANYEPCGTPLNYQIKAKITKTVDGEATVAEKPANPPVNGVAYIPIARLGYAFNAKFTIDAVVNGVKYSKGWHTVYGFRADGTPSGYERLYTAGFQAEKPTYNTAAAEGTSRVSNSSTLNTLYGNTASSKLRNSWRNTIKTWINKNDTMPAIPDEIWTGSGRQPTTGQMAADWAKVFVTNQLAVIDDPTPPACADGSCSVPSTPITQPTCTTAACEQRPDITTEVPPENPPVADGRFAWAVNAVTKPYLEVKSGTASSTMTFTATPMSVWKTATAANQYLDDQGHARMDQPYQNALSSRQSQMANNVGPAGQRPWANARWTTVIAPDYNGMTWAMRADYSGLGINTYLPQCNTGQASASGCPPKTTAWNQSPQLNPSCTTAACYTTRDVDRKNVLPASGSIGTTDYAVGSPLTLGMWQYNFYAATSKDKVVRVDRAASTPLDINVSYHSTAPDKARWVVGMQYQEWYKVYEDENYDYTCTKWVGTGRYFAPGAPYYGAEITAPQDATCTGTRSVWKGQWGISDWIDNSAGDTFDTYTLPSSQSGVILVNGRSLNGGEGGAGCQVPNTAWNYCSPVLSGKVNR